MNEGKIRTNVKYSKRRTLSLTVTHDNQIMIKAPTGTPKSFILNFIESKKSWISRQLESNNKTTMVVNSLFSGEIDIKKQKIIAKTITAERALYWSDQMHLNFKKIRLSSAKTRWGSCSYDNTISINWRLSLLPLELLDYVLVHEIAHIKEKNHSSAFWKIIANHCIDFKVKRKVLKEHGSILQAI